MVEIIYTLKGETRYIVENKIVINEGERKETCGKWFIPILM
jgi:hypothetical protein